MKTFPLLAAVILFLPCLSRAADNPAPMAPLVHAKTASFMAQIFFVAAEPGGSMRRGQTFLVWAKRPASLKITDFRDYPRGQEIIVLPFSRLVSDGKMQIEKDEDRGVYVKRKAARDLAHIVSEGDVTTYLALDILFAADPLRGFQETAAIKWGPRSIRVFVRRRVVRGVAFERRLYVERDTGLPVRVANFVADHPGHLTEGDRTELINWRLNFDIRPDPFKTTPPVGMKPATATRKAN